MNLPWPGGADPINAPYDVSDGRKSAEGKQENGREASLRRIRLQDMTGVNC